MITTQTGVSGPYVLEGTGDEYVVNGIVSNIDTTSRYAVFSTGATNTITNNGVISSMGQGVAISASAEGLTVNNTGLIAGVVRSYGAFTLNNSGTMVGYIQAQPVETTVGHTITNSGTLTFSSFGRFVPERFANAAIVLYGTDDTVTNSGKIVGNVQLGDGNNTFDGRGGHVHGTVMGGVGNDTYNLTSATDITDAGGTDTVIARFAHTLGTGFENLTLTGFGNFDGTGNEVANTITGNNGKNLLTGLGGDDILSGGKGADTLLGGYGNDQLNGGNDADSLNGGFGNDTLMGEDGKDVLVGDTGADLLDGGNGNDLLDGGTGADTMLGGAGDDILVGGSFGKDVMTGGEGADAFVFLVATDSFATAAADVITDFEHGLDKIDLSALIDGDLLFNGTGAFSAGVGSVRFKALASTDTAVLIDLDGNGKADMQIVLTGTHVMTVDDFVL